MTENEIFTLSANGIQNITKTTVKHKKIFLGKTLRKSFFTVRPYVDDIFRPCLDF